jgi:hypothetical protein
MFLRHTKRWKDGKQHFYWSIGKNRRRKGGRIVQHTVLSPGERSRANPHFSHPFYCGLSFPVVAAFRLLAPRAAG